MDKTGRYKFTLAWGYFQTIMVSPRYGQLDRFLFMFKSVGVERYFNFWGCAHPSVSNERVEHGEMVLFPTPALPTAFVPPGHLWLSSIS